MPPPIDITGQRFGRLIAISRSDNNPFNGSAAWICKCDCGTELLVRSASMRKGDTRSCGCLLRDRTRERMLIDGRSRHPLYTVWATMIGRCYFPGNSSYERYGARGITVCDRWRKDFHNFLSDMGERPPGMSVDRINNNGPYSPENCRWATVQTQLSNRRTSRFLTYQGKTQTIAEWARETGLDCRNLYCRLQRFGDDPAKVLDPRRHPGSIPQIFITHQGKTQSIPRWAAEIGVDRITIYKRFRDFGDNPEKVLQPSRTRNSVLTYNGVTQTIPAWARTLNVNPHTLYRRFYRHGNNPEKVLHVGRLPRPKRDSVIHTVPLQLTFPFR